jgi:hypothetical protein
VPNLLGSEIAEGRIGGWCRLSGGVLLAAALSLTHLPGCSGNEKSTPAASPTPPDDMQEPEPEPTPVCHSGDDCECADGRPGTSACDGGEAVCDCDSCPQYAPDDAVRFEACGGEPFGVWQSEEISAPGFALELLRPDALGNYSSAGNCPTQVTDLTAQSSLRLALLDGGDAVLAGAAGISLSFKLLDACVQEKVAQSCTELRLNGDCVETCGVCECDVTGGSMDSEGTWSRHGSTLSMSLSNQWTMDYCVTGDEMVVRDSAGILIKMRRINLFSSPTACADRSPEVCNRGCSPGACVGGETCEAASDETNCTNRQGCTWDRESCVGQPEPCNLADYGIVPGCDLTETPLLCRGTRLPCRDSDAASCPAAAGCEVGPGCDGGVVRCGNLTGACSFCEDVDGCTYCGQDTAVCGGSSTCAEQKSSYACGQVQALGMGDCQWVDSLCNGKPVPCAELPPEACSSAPGCELEPATAPTP